MAHGILTLPRYLPPPELRGIRPNRRALNLWVEALESGAYTQLRQCWSNGPRRGCVLAVAVWVMQEQQNVPPSAAPHLHAYELEGWLGLDTMSLRYIMHLNDSTSFTFPQLAMLLRTWAALPKRQPQFAQAPALPVQPVPARPSPFQPVWDEELSPDCALVEVG